MGFLWVKGSYPISYGHLYASNMVMNVQLLSFHIETLRTRLAEFLQTGAVIEIPAGSYVTFVDAEDAPRVLEYTWTIFQSRRTFYAQVRRGFQQHRFILGLTDPKVLVDHRDSCGINNTRDNIRIANFQQNAANRRKIDTSTSSRFKGVLWQSNTKDKPWMAHIKYNRKKLFLGRYATEEEAALAYNKAALEYFGEFANLNEIDGSTYYQQDSSSSPHL